MVNLQKTKRIFLELIFLAKLLCQCVRLDLIQTPCIRYFYSEKTDFNKLSKT